MNAYGKYFDVKTQNTALEIAIKAGDWIVNNQIRDELDEIEGRPALLKNITDANRGRFTCLYAEAPPTTIPGINWNQGIGIGALLCLHKRTGNEKYLNSAIRAGEYVKSLQVMCPDNDKTFGIIREMTPQTDWVNCRDGATAAYALLCLYTVTGDVEYLNRAKLYFNWHIKYPRTDSGWVNYLYRMDLEPYELKEYAFQAGVGFMLYSLYKITGDNTYLEKGLLPLLDGYINIFLNKDGSHIHLLQESGNTEGSRHFYNDDFVGVSLLSAYRHYKNDRYLEASARFMKWLVRVQKTDGSYGENRFYSCANGTSINFMADYCGLTDDPISVESAIKSVKFIESIQIKSNDLKWDGGIQGEWDYPAPAIHIRSVAYAIMGLLKLEGAMDYPYFSSVPVDY